MWFGAIQEAEVEGTAELHKNRANIYKKLNKQINNVLHFKRKLRMQKVYFSQTLLKVSNCSYQPKMKKKKCTKIQ